MKKILIILIPLLLNVFAIYYSPKRKKIIQDNIYPIRTAEVSSGFGKRGNKYHWGVDFRAPHGTPVIAPVDMKFYKTGWNENHGLHVIGQDLDGFYYVFAHLSKIQKNDTEIYYQGQTIGYVGNTGLSYGPHLHYEISFNGVHFNPINFTKKNFQPEYIDDEIDRYTSFGLFDFFDLDDFFDLSFIIDIKDIIYL
jgi:murein DD-endopeptidase MepM/ murein hydrolase activator NlpD